MQRLRRPMPWVRPRPISARSRTLRLLALGFQEDTPRISAFPSNIFRNIIPKSMRRFLAVHMRPNNSTRLRQRNTNLNLTSPMAMFLHLIMLHSNRHTYPSRRISHCSRRRRLSHCLP